MAKPKTRLCLVMNAGPIIRAGRGSACHAWNTITEVVLLRRQRWRVTSVSSGYAGSARGGKSPETSDISLEELPRFSTGFKEFDRVRAAAWCQEAPF